MVSMMNCFGFSRETMLINTNKQWCFSCFSCLWAVRRISQGLSACHDNLSGRRFVCTRRWDGTEPEKTDLNWPKGYPIPHGFMLKDKVGRVGWGCCHCLGTDWALVNGWQEIALCITCFFLICSSYYISLPFLRY